MNVVIKNTKAVNNKLDGVKLVESLRTLITNCIFINKSMVGIAIKPIQSE